MDWRETVAFAFAAVGIGIVVAVWHHIDVDAETDLTTQLREARVQVIETCGNEPDTHLDECVEDMMAVVEAEESDG